MVTRAFAELRRRLPVLARAVVARQWAGLIDLSADGLPIIDFAAPSVVFATGLSGHGFALGPVLGSILADLALHGATRWDIGPFRAARFAHGPVPLPARLI